MLQRYRLFAPICFALLLLLGSNQAHAQRRWRVNNTPGVNADFTTIQAAHDAATTGDIIYVEGSFTAYGDVTFTKRITLIGTGYFLSENSGVTATTLQATMGSITLNTGSAGSVIKGCSFFIVTINDVGNLTISRNNMSGVRNNSAVITDPINIIQNYIGGNSIALGGSLANLFIGNNFIEGSISLSQTTTAVINNNTIQGSITVTNSTLANNIMTNTGTFSQTGSSWSNNLGSGTQFGTANGNQNNVIMANVFVGATGNSTDGKWRLRPGSPAIGAGTGGVDCGMFGGGTPYVLSGITNIPTITNFSTTATGNNTTPLNVTISTQSNR
ncbi:MAG: hypothetical protein V4714_21955 [Bacteroidota bacterium]